MFWSMPPVLTYSSIASDAVDVAMKLDSQRNVVGQWIFPPSEAA
jgi:hypothetical protein